MGCIQYFDEKLLPTQKEISAAVVPIEPCEISLWQNHLLPEIRIKVLDGTNRETIATFPNAEQFARFAEQVKKLNSHS